MAKITVAKALNCRLCCLVPVCTWLYLFVAACIPPVAATKRSSHGKAALNEGKYGAQVTDWMPEIAS